MSRRIPYAEVAEIVRSWPTPRGYIAHIAEKYGIPIASARRWVAMTRREGLLPACGEHPCPTCGGTGVRSYNNRWHT